MCVYTWCVHVNLCMCVSLFSDCSVCYRVLISEKGGISQLILTNKQTPKWLMAQTQCKFLSHGKSKRGTSGPRAALFPWLFRNPNSSYLLPPSSTRDFCDCCAKLAASNWWKGKEGGAPHVGDIPGPGQISLLLIPHWLELTLSQGHTYCKGCWEM